MTLAGFYFRQFSMIQYIDFAFRLLLAFFIGGTIGLERSNHFKEAGIRTHILVCVTAALIMLISKYGFADLSGTEMMETFGTKGADSARVAAQAVSGISFLWMTAGIGLAIGAGMYFVVVVTVVLLWIVQYALYKMPFGADSYDSYHVVLKIRNAQDFDAELQTKLKELEVQITDSNITWTRDGGTEYDFILRRAESIDYNELKQFVAEHEEIISYSYCPITRSHVI